MDLIADFHFLRPAWLLALLPLALLLWRSRQKAAAPVWSRAVDPELLPALSQEAAPAMARGRALWAIGAVLAIVALAGPSWQRLPSPVFETDLARVLVVDLSRSMDAADLSPSRLARARYAAIDLLAGLQDGRFGLVAFAGSAFTVAPLTRDTQTVRHLLDALSSDLMPVPGGRIGPALRQAVELLRSGGAVDGDVILLTDSGVDADALAAAGELRAAGYRLRVVGIGTTGGAPVPEAGGGWVQAADGSVVVARLVEAPLRELAKAGGGDYRRLPPTGLSPGAFERPAVSAHAADERYRTDQWRDEGRWLVLLLLPIAAFACRRGLPLTACLLLFLGAPTAQAAGSPWWQNADQRGHALLQAGEAQAAAETFRDRRWQAVARYRAGDYAGAAELLADAQSADDHYNRGNALARAGDLDGAIRAYEQALALNPDMDDARHNRELVERLRQQQQQQQQQQNQGQNQNQDQGQNQGQNQNQDQNQDQDQGQGQDQGQQDSSAPPRSSSQDGGDGAASAGQDDAAQATGAERAESDPPAQAGAERDGAEAGESPAQAAQREAEAEAARQALEQWLRRVPDDPGGLLRRKFLRDQQQREPPAEVEQTW